MLQSLCAGHPQMAMAREFGNFAELGKDYLVYARYVLKRLARINAKWTVAPWPVRMPFRVPVNSMFVVRYLYHLSRLGAAAIGPNEAEAALTAMFPSRSPVGDKWPDYIWILDGLANAPNLRCVVIYRDCRDVTSSTLRLARTVWRRRHFVGSLNTAPKVAKRWVECIEIMERNADKVFVLRYEELVRRPEVHLRNMGEWLGVDPDGFPAHVVRDTSVGKFRTGLTEQELAEIDDIAGPTMARLGYQ